MSTWRWKAGPATPSERDTTILQSCEGFVDGLSPCVCASRAIFE